MSDPLGLDSIPTPKTILDERRLPLRAIADLHRRVISNDFADSLETKVAILAHMIYLAYTDLKDINTR